MKKRLKIEAKEKLLDEFAQSGCTQAIFSRMHNLNPKTLSRWLSDRQTERVGKEKDFNKNLTDLFMPVEIEESTPNVCACAVLKRSTILTLRIKDFSLEIPARFKGEEQLSTIIKVLHAL
ncbi:MAG: hypothetical protein CNLJKLNK_01257 [Holosporales bacterium]